MPRFLRDTWLATVVFVTIGLLIGNADPREPIYFRAGLAATAAILVPTVWWWFVVRRAHPRMNHAAFAGATLAYLTLTLPVTLGWAWSDASPFITGRPADDGGLGGLLNVFVLLYVLGGVPVLGALGAGIGMGVLCAHRSWASLPAQPSPPDTPLDGALWGAQIAVLAGPLVALIGGIVLFELFPPKPRWATYPIVLMGTWVITVPAGAVLGIGWLKRWRRIEVAHMSVSERAPQAPNAWSKPDPTRSTSQD